MKRKEHYKNNYNEYWKNRGFDFYTELQIHQYLCGFKLRKKPEKCFVRKQEWIDDVKESHESKDILTLRDLKDFWGLQKCNTESDNIIMANLVLPIFAVLVTSFFDFEVFRNNGISSYFERLFLYLGDYYWFISLDCIFLRIEIFCEPKCRIGI